MDTPNCTISCHFPSGPKSPWEQRSPLSSKLLKRLCSSADSWWDCPQHRGSRSFPLFMRKLIFCHRENEKLIYKTWLPLHCRSGASPTAESLASLVFWHYRACSQVISNMIRLGFSVKHTMTYVLVLVGPGQFILMLHWCCSPMSVW